MGCGNRKIGFFDSGLGGLTILKATAKELPSYDYIFYGDTEHLPLGDKTEEEIFSYTKIGVEELFKRDCQLVIIACNTASAETLRRLQDGFLKENYPDRRILGVVIPTIETLIDSNSTGALLIATKRTVESRKYDNELKNRSQRDIRLYSVATPSLVPLIESGDSSDALRKAIETIEEELMKHHFDTVILGCTHYTKLKDGLRSYFSNHSTGTNIVDATLSPSLVSHKLTFLSQDEIIPHKLAYYIKSHAEIESKLGQGGTRSIYLTLHRPDYDHTIKELLGGIIL